MPAARMFDVDTAGRGGTGEPRPGIYTAAWQLHTPYMYIYTLSVYIHVILFGFLYLANFSVLLFFLFLGKVGK